MKKQLIIGSPRPFSCLLMTSSFVIQLFLDAYPIFLPTSNSASIISPVVPQHFILPAVLLSFSCSYSRVADSYNSPFFLWTCDIYPSLVYSLLWIFLFVTYSRALLTLSYIDSLLLLLLISHPLHSKKGIATTPIPCSLSCDGTL